MSANEFTLLSPTGHLSYVRMERESFERGVARRPDAICADAGSCDIGPYPLGADTCASEEEWQRHDLELMLCASRALNVPMVVGSANDCGSNRGVDKFVRLLKEIAARHKLPPFKLASIRHAMDKEFLRRTLARGERIAGLDGFPDLDAARLDATDNLVPVMGAEPMVRALQQGAQVVVTSRTSDCCIFAAPALAAGFPKAVAYFAGKLLECASFCAEPYMGKESVLGTVGRDYVRVEALHPQQRCTPASVAGHAMYERADPCSEAVAGGRIEMTGCRYETYDPKTTHVTGSRFSASDAYRVKLEGAGKVGERRYVIAGIRDPENIRRLDSAIGWAKGKVEEHYGPNGERYQLYYHVYGRNGVMGNFEPTPEIRGHEVCVVAEAVAPEAALAEQVVKLAVRGIFYARIETKGTAGGAALPTDDVLAGQPAYRWTLNHLVRLDDPCELFPITLETVGG